MAQRVFIDANHLIRFGHGLKGAEAMTLRELIEVGAVSLTTTDLTVREVAKRFAKHETEKLHEITKTDFRSRAKRYLKLDLPEVSREDLWKMIFSEHFKTVSDFFLDVHAQVLTIEGVSPLIVLDDYTHSRGLFSASSKKDQFPDAFIFEALRSSVNKERSLIVLSEDGDFAQACEAAEYIQRISKFETLFESLGIATADEETYELVERFEDAFREPIEELLQEYMIHAEDVEDCEMEVLSVSSATIESLTVYRSTKKRNTYLVYAKVACKAEVSFTHPDWDSAIWDSEDKVAIPWETVEGRREVEIDDQPFTFTFEYNQKKDTAKVLNPSLRGDGFIITTLYAREDYY